jgi:hypothetical protein
LLRDQGPGTSIAPVLVRVVHGSGGDYVSDLALIS